MICSACHRRVNADRSFCPNCGSAVFIEESDREWRQARAAARSSGADELGSNVPEPPAPRAPRRRPEQRATPTATTRPAPSAGCLGCLVRLVLVAVVMWYVGRWLLAIPEVQTLVNAFRSGSFNDDQVTAAVDAIRAHIAQLFGASPSSR